MNQILSRRYRCNHPATLSNSNGLNTSARGLWDFVLWTLYFGLLRMGRYMCWYRWKARRPRGGTRLGGHQERGTLGDIILLSWITVFGLQIPAILKSQWKPELSALFEAATAQTNDVLFLGDFNCDLLHPNKPPRAGRELTDLLQIFDLQNVVKSATRTSKRSETLLDLILTNKKRRILTSAVVDAQISDHSLVPGAWCLGATIAFSQDCFPKSQEL